jgi:hypothetical protein
MRALRGLISLLLFTLGVLALSVPALADDGPMLRKQRFAGSGHVGQVQLQPLQFEFACHPARNGALSVSVVLSKGDSAGGFALDAYEGPDGVGGDSDVAEWSVDTRGDALQVKGPIGGWYGVDGDGFILSRSQPNAKPDALGKLVSAVVDAKSRRLRVSVAAHGKGEPLQAELLLDGKHDAIRTIVAACL